MEQNMHDFALYTAQGLRIEGVAAFAKGMIDAQLTTKLHKVDASTYGDGKVGGHTLKFYVKQGLVTLALEYRFNSIGITLLHADNEQSAQVAEWLDPEIRSYIERAIPDVNRVFPIVAEVDKRKR